MTTVSMLKFPTTEMISLISLDGHLIRKTRRPLSMLRRSLHNRVLLITPLQEAAIRAQRCSSAKSAEAVCSLEAPTLTALLRAKA